MNNVPPDPQLETLNEFLHEADASLENLARLASARRLYAVMDACDEPAVPDLVQGLGEARAVSLYRGSAEEHLWAIAPYLVQVDEEVLEWMKKLLLRQSGWGIFAVSEADLDTLRRHFRKFLMVRLPDGNRVYFRFYDPRVLSKFLRACNHQELVELFGPVRSYGVTIPEQDGVTLLRRTD